MDRKYIERHLAVDRYLRGTLSEGEAAEFADRLAWDQQLIDELALSECLYGLREAAGERSYLAFCQLERIPRHRPGSSSAAAGPGL